MSEQTHRIAAVTGLKLPGRALTLTQPWATLMVLGAKRIETRSWATKHRGVLGIHAAKRFPPDCRHLVGLEPFATALAIAGITDPAQLPLGALLGHVVLADCVELGPESFAAIDARERAFGDYTPGRYGWITMNATRYEQPIPMRGARGHVFEVKR